MENEKRRQRGTGSIFRRQPSAKERAAGARASKNWFIQFYKNGRKIREAAHTTDRTVAAKLLRQRLHEIDQHKYVAQSGKPARVEDLHRMLKLDREANHRPTNELRGRWLHLEPVFGRMLANEVTTDHIREYTRARQKAGAKDSTINRELGILKRMFNLGRQSTPPKVTVLLHIPMLKENNVRTGFVEDVEFSRLVAEAKELWLRTFLELGFSYGWRHGELIGLRVRQVNFTNRTIRLDVGTTKNKEGREVVMTGVVEKLLREACRGKKPDDYVLTRQGRRIGCLKNAWRNMCVRAGLGKFTCCACKAGLPGAERCEDCGSKRRRYSGLIPHDMRRSAAKALRAAGVPESVVMTIGGWKTASMFRRYAIVSSADQRAAVEMLERARAERVAVLTPEISSFCCSGGMSIPK